MTRVASAMSPAAPRARRVGPNVAAGPVPGQARLRQDAGAAGRGAPEPPGLAFVVQKHAASAPPLRLPPRARRRAQELGRAQGAEPRPRRQAPRHADRGPSRSSTATSRASSPRASTAAARCSLWDRGTWEPDRGSAQGLREGRLKFTPPRREAARRLGAGPDQGPRRARRGRPDLAPDQGAGRARAPGRASAASPRRGRRASLTGREPRGDRATPATASGTRTGRRRPHAARRRPGPIARARSRGRPRRPFRARARPPARRRRAAARDPRRRRRPRATSGSTR